MILLRRALPLLVLAAAGCTDASRMAMGDVNSIIVVAEDSLWAEVGDTVLSTLQPRIFAVRDEPTFNLTHVAPGHSNWGDLRRFRQILAIGEAADPWVREALEEAEATGGAAPGSGDIVEADDVWARSQRVTALLVPSSDAADVVLARLDSLAALFDRRYRVWAQARMFFSGHDEALADTLRQLGGFTLDIPQVYRWRRTGDASFMFLNDEPDASTLVRSLLVTWRAGTEGAVTPEEALAWRDSVAAELYDWDQTTQRDRLETRRLQVRDAPGQEILEVRGAWSTRDEFPQGGPFITRVVDCPGQDRRYLLDAWLYAPTRDKYQYMIQLETLLESFRCGQGGRSPGGSAGAPAA